MSIQVHETQSQVFTLSYFIVEIVCVCVCVCIHTHTHTHTHIYIYREMNKSLKKGFFLIQKSAQILASRAGKNLKNCLLISCQSYN